MLCPLVVPCVLSGCDPYGLVCIECTFRHSRVGSRTVTVTTDCSGGNIDSGSGENCCNDVNPGQGGSDCYSLSSWRLCGADDDTPPPPPCWDCCLGEYATYAGYASTCALAVPTCGIICLRVGSLSPGCLSCITGLGATMSLACNRAADAYDELTDCLYQDRTR
ncbi:hypothetical protein Q31b_02890 [Novipirellula aureliae]|uniref:Uncharacterized protein n=1 Tax=Novipirellula aureliae TaxID=2527966 RepID=A0A5C6E8I7_9BACT|nr:hypothetical protein Q31b_02890 [Novipirellula aureliae]